jgi:hypothetical protein
MVSQAETKLRRVNSRHTIYVRKSLVNDSAFPFNVDEPLIIRIEGKRLVIERKES